MRTVKIKEFEIPVRAMSKVANIPNESEPDNSITGTDDHDDDDQGEN